MGKERNLQPGKSGQAPFGTPSFGSKTPSPPPPAAQKKPCPRPPGGQDWYGGGGASSGDKVTFQFVDEISLRDSGHPLPHVPPPWRRWSGTAALSWAVRPSATSVSHIKTLRVVLTHPAPRPHTTDRPQGTEGWGCRGVPRPMAPHQNADVVPPAKPPPPPPPRMTCSGRGRATMPSHAGRGGARRVTRRPARVVPWYPDVVDRTERRGARPWAPRCPPPPLSPPLSFPLFQSHRGRNGFGR